MNFNSGNSSTPIRHQLPQSVTDIFSKPPQLALGDQRYEFGPVVAENVRKIKAFFRQGILITISALNEVLKFSAHSKAVINSFDSVRYIPQQPDCKIALQNLLEVLVLPKTPCIVNNLKNLIL